MKILKQIFSITKSSNRKHKIVTILGVKLKFKRAKYKKIAPVVKLYPYHKFNYKGIKHIANNSYCTGCTACKSICPHGAITMVENKEGFMMPQVDENKCIHCGLCDKICPVINFKFQNAPQKSICYAAQGNDEIRINSSSGGIFSILAEHIIQNGGYVCGARFSEDFHDVYHEIISNTEDIKYLRLSKYVQSDLKDVFVRIKELLENKKVVLFTGTPCQVSGIKAYLKKNYENLYLADLSCGGCPSKKVYRKFLNECIKDYPDEQITSVKFRMKDKGWYSYASEYKTSSHTYRIPNSKSIYQQAFLQGLSINKICQVCPYDTLKREGDLSLGDFWGINRFDKECDDAKGTSLIIVNSLKGQNLLNEIKKSLKLCKKSSIDWAVVDNYNLIKPISHHNRNQFFYNLDKMSLNDNYQKCIRDQADCIVFNHAITSFNYGSVLTAYAIQQVLCNMGYYTKILNTQRVPFPDYIGSFGQKFARDYLNLTEPCQSETDFTNLNNKSDIFFVGSDQVWRTKYWKNDLDRVLLNFVETNKKKIGMAVSFGVDEFEGTEEEKAIFKKALPTFTGISTRENSGVDICKKEFNCDATWILDPVFIHNKQDFIKMAKLSDFDCSDKVVYYGWDYTGSISKLELIADINNCNGIVDITGKQLSVEDWLNAIRTSKYFVSNSYHGICFAMIFNKNFICINDIGEGRFNSLNSLLNIGSKIVDNINDITETKIHDTPNYEYINASIQNMQQQSLKFINEVLR